MKWPMVFITSVYALGLVLGDFLQPPLAWLFAAAFLTAVAALLLGKPRVLLPAFLIFLTGWTNMAWRKTVLAPDDLQNVMGDTTEIVRVRGRLRETPTTRTFQLKDRSVTSFLAELEIRELHRHKSGWQPAVGTVLARTPGEVPESLFRGEFVEVEGVLGPPPPPLSGELFNYPAYLSRRGIHYQIRASSIEDWLVLSSGKLPVSDRLLRWGERMLARGLPARDNAYHLLCAMTLGSRDGLSQQVYEPFTRSGTMHIFAISGLHIVLIAGMCMALLRSLRLPRAVCGWIVIPSLWFYTQATGWQPSAIRATIMMTVIIAGYALRRPANLLNSLAAAAFIILVWDPHQLFGASFQLSFFVVLSMAVLISPLEKWFEALTAPDPLLPAELFSSARRFAMVPLRVLKKAFSPSLAAWLGALPLTLHYFHLVSPVALLANLVVIPLSSLALGANLASLLVGPFAPAISELFNHSAWFLMVCMVGASEWATAIPGGYFYLPAMTWYGSAVYYFLLFGGFCGLLKQRWGLVVSGAAVALVVGQLALSTLTYEVVVLPHQAGTLIHCDGPGTHNDVLVDAGLNNAASMISLPILRARGVNGVSRLLLSHGDARHVGAAELLIRELSPREVLVGTAPSRSPIYRRVVRQFEGTPGKLAKVSRGDQVGAFTVLHPEANDRFSRGDDNAVVLHGTFFGTRVLLVSDLGGIGQTALLAREPDLKADIVIAGLPANGEPLCDELLDRLEPRTLIICDADLPAAERAGRRLRQRLASRGLQVLYLSEQGSLRFTFAPWSRGQPSILAASMRR